MNIAGLFMNLGGSTDNRPVAKVVKSFTKANSLGPINQTLFKTDKGYILASAINNMLAHETYLFSADRHGKIMDYQELPGSQKNTTDILTVMEEAGYRVER